jgi:hypothetical protein
MLTDLLDRGLRLPPVSLRVLGGDPVDLGRTFGDRDTRVDEPLTGEGLRPTTGLDEREGDDPVPVRVDPSGFGIPHQHPLEVPAHEAARARCRRFAWRLHSRQNRRPLLTHVLTSSYG